jgi:ABC-type iron transport system FetAB permease component
MAVMSIIRRACCSGTSASWIRSKYESDLYLVFFFFVAQTYDQACIQYLIVQQRRVSFKKPPREQIILMNIVVAKSLVKIRLLYNFLFYFARLSL